MSWLGDVKGNQERKEEEKKKREQEIQRLSPMVSRVLDEVGRTLWGSVHFTTMFPFIMANYSVDVPDQYSQVWKLHRASESCKVVYFVDSQSGTGKFSIEWLNESNYTKYSEYTTDTSEEALKNALRAIISKTHYLK